MPGPNDLSQFRRRPVQEPVRPTPSVSPTEGGDDGGESTPEIYEAFKTVNRRQITLEIRTTGKAWEWISYGYLLNVVGDAPFFKRIVLVFTFMGVEIVGRNLRPVAAAIARQNCESIQQFDAGQWPLPTNPEAPVIDKIEFKPVDFNQDVLREASDDMKEDA
jgi:hypothetical protein